MFVQKNSPSDAHPFRESYSWMTEKMSRGDQTSCNCNYCSHFAMDRRSRLPSLNQIFLYRLKDSSKSMAAFVSQPVSLRPLHVMKHFFCCFLQRFDKKGSLFVSSSVNIPYVQSCLVVELLIFSTGTPNAHPLLSGIPSIMSPFSVLGMNLIKQFYNFGQTAD